LPFYHVPGVASSQTQSGLTPLLNIAPVMKTMCCYCVPWHVIREGVEPASHGICDAAMVKWNAELDAMETP